MKIRIIIIGAFLLCFISFFLVCTNSQDNPKALNGEQLMLGWANFWKTKDIDQLDIIYNNSAVYEDVPDGTAYEGLAAIKRSLLEDITYAPDVIVEIISVLVSENRGILEWNWSGTQTGDISGLMPATGKKFSVRGISIFEFKNNKIIKQSDYYDAATFLYQLGVKFEFPSKK